MAKFLVGVALEAVGYTAIKTGVAYGLDAIIGKAKTKKEKQEQDKQAILNGLGMIVDSALPLYGLNDVGYSTKQLLSPGNRQINSGGTLVTYFTEPMVSMAENLKVALTTKDKRIRQRALIGATGDFVGLAAMELGGIPYRNGTKPLFNMWEDSIK